MTTDVKYEARYVNAIMIEASHIIEQENALSSNKVKKEFTVSSQTITASLGVLLKLYKEVESEEHEKLVISLIENILEDYAINELGSEDISVH